MINTQDTKRYIVCVYMPSDDVMLVMLVCLFYLLLLFKSVNTKRSHVHSTADRDLKFEVLVFYYAFDNIII